MDRSGQTGRRASWTLHALRWEAGGRLPARRKATVKGLEGIPAEMIGRLLEAADDKGVALVVRDRRFIVSSSLPVTPEQAALYLLDEDLFWMNLHGVKEERYYSWRKHIERLEDDQVPCLGTKPNRQSCAKKVHAAPDPKRYDPKVHDYCRSHQDQCPTG